MTDKSAPPDLRKLLTAKSLLGAAIGALMGGVFSGGPWGAALGAGVGAVAFEVAPKRRKGVMTPERKIIFEKAIATIMDPEELRAYASEFEKHGLHAQATVLRCRADQRALPEAVKLERRKIFREAFSWTKPDDIEGLADQYEKQCLFKAALKLRIQAGAVRAADEAGATGKPAPTASIDTLRESFVEVIRQFGPTSGQAISAAITYLHATGNPTPNEAEVHAAIEAATPAGMTPPAAAAPPPPPAAAPPAEATHEAAPEAAVPPPPAAEETPA